MMQMFALGAGTGFVSAVLFAITLVGSSFAILLSYLAPVPITIASLGWSHRTGLIATAFGAGALAILLKISVGAVFAVGVGGPAWALAFLALMAKHENACVQWCSVNTLLLAASGLSAIIALCGALSLDSSYEGYVTDMRQAVGTILHPPGGEAGPSPAFLSVMSLEDLTALVVKIVPIAAGFSLTAMFLGNLWVGAKVVHISGRLPRPWPDLRHVFLSRSGVAVFAGAAALSMTGGFLGVASQALAGGFLLLFTLEGLAAFHVLTLGRPGRVAILGVFYLVLFLFMIWVIPLVALGGLIHALARKRLSLEAS